MSKTKPWIESHNFIDGMSLIQNYKYILLSSSDNPAYASDGSYINKKNILDLLYLIAVYIFIYRA